MTNTLSENLKKLLEKRRINLTELAKKSGIDKPRISRILSGKTTNPQIDTLRPIAEFFGITLDQLIGKSPLPNDETYGVVVQINRLIVPIIDWKIVPHWLEMKDQIKPRGKVYAKETTSPDSYALAIHDEQFLPRFSMNTIIIVNPRIAPHNRDYIVTHEVALGHLTIKQFIEEDGKQFLKSVGTPFTMARIKEPYSCWGVIVEAHHDLSIKTPVAPL